MIKPRHTIYDVARHAGVAISTVSRVLNNSADVSEPTRARVLRAIDELQFRPDRTARSLAHRQVVTLAVATPTFTMPFHNELLKGIRYRLRAHDEEAIELLLRRLHEGYETPPVSRRIVPRLNVRETSHTP